MRITTLLLALLAGGLAHDVAMAQSSATLADLMAEMPAQVQAQTFDLLTFSRSVQPFAYGSSDSVREAIPVMQTDLQSSNTNVRENALAVVSMLANRLDGGVLLGPILPLVTETASRSQDTAGKLALLSLARLGTSAPDASFTSIEQTLNGQPEASVARAGYMETLLRMRPTSDAVAAIVIRQLEDPAAPPDLHSRLLYASGVPGANQRIVQKLVDYANSLTDKVSRDASIAALGRIGPTALRQVQGTLSKISADNTEPLASRKNARSALDSLGSK